MTAKKKKRRDLSQPEKEFQVNPFEGLDLDLPDGPREKPEDKQPAAESTPKESARLSGDDKELLEQFGSAEMALPDRRPQAILRFERKGRGGKSVTVVEGLTRLDMDEQMELLRHLKRSLGIGGAFKNDELVLQGDQRQRVTEFLEKRGFNVRGMTG